MDGKLLKKFFLQTSFSKLFSILPACCASGREKYLWIKLKLNDYTLWSCLGMTHTNSTVRKADQEGVKKPVIQRVKRAVGSIASDHLHSVL